MQLLGPWTRDNKDPRETLERLLFLVYLDIPTTQTAWPLDKALLLDLDQQVRPQLDCGDPQTPIFCQSGHHKDNWHYKSLS